MPHLGLTTMVIFLKRPMTPAYLKEILEITGTEDLQAGKRSAECSVKVIRWRPARFDGRQI